MELEKYLKWFFCVLIAVILLLAGLGIYINLAGNAHVEKMMEARYMLIDAMEIKQRNINNVINDVDMVVTSPWRIDVDSQTEGRLEKVAVHAGDKVKQGQLLAVVDNSAVLSNAVASEADIEGARAELSNSEIQVQRYGKLLTVDAVSREIYDNAVARRDALQARLDGMIAKREISEEQVRRLTITAPRDGTVVSVYYKEGSYVRVGQPIVLLADVEKMEAKLVLNHRQVKNIMDDNGGSFMVEVPERLMDYRMYPAPQKLQNMGKDINKFLLHVNKVMPEAEQDVRQHTIEAELLNHDGLLEPVTYQDVKVYTQTTQQLLSVPIMAVHNFGKNNHEDEYVFVINATGQLSKRSVKTGLSDDAFAEVLEGLSPGEYVAVSQATFLRDGMKIKPRMVEENKDG